MKKTKIINILIILLLVATINTGCNKEGSIKIRHKPAGESFKNMTNEKQEPKSVVKKSSGIIIYKDVSTTNNTKIKATDFGPKDIDFDQQFRANQIFK